MIHIINSNKLSEEEINKAAIIKHPDFLATVETTVRTNGRIRVFVQLKLI